METYYCIGNEKATQVCRNKFCQQKNPFVCENYRGCQCSMHNHNSQYQLMTISKFLESVDSLKTKQLIQSKSNLDQAIQKMEFQFRELMNQFKQKTTQIIQESKFAQSFLKKDLYQSFFIKKQSFEQSTGSKIYLLRKASKVKKSRSQIQSILNNRIKELIISSKQLYQNFSISMRKNLQDLNNEMNNMNQSSEIQVVVVDQDVQYLKSLVENNKIELINKPFKLPKLISNNFQQLINIKIENCVLQTASFKAFEKYSNQNLKILALLELGLTDQALTYIIKAKLPNLIQFKAFINLITEKGCQILASANWPKIGYFNLHSNKINSNGAKWMVNKYSNRLWRLDLDYNSLEDECEKCFYNNKWEKITEIHLFGNEFSARAYNDLESFFKKIIKPQKIFIKHN